MAQLADDCFAFGGALMPPAMAEALIAERIVAIGGSEAVALADALGRTLAEDVLAGVSVPPHDNSAVDGFAVYFDDLSRDAETVLPIGGRAAAGHPLGRPQRRGEAIRIFTGAVMPGGDGDGPDTVMMQEDCTVTDGAVRIRPGIRRGSNRRRAGEDVAAGTLVVPAGRRLRAQEIGMAAAVGRTSLAVRPRLRAALFSTGDEIRAPGDALPAGTVYDSNRYTIAALLAGLGVAVDDLGILPDRFEAIRDALAAAARDHALIVTSGGMSTGEEDHVKAAVEATGRLDFWRLAIKPGRPVALGRIGEAIFLGLPGNPVAVMVTFMTVARPLIFARGGAAADPPLAFPVRADFEHKKKRDRREYVRARLVAGADGIPVAQKHPREGAGILSSMVESDGLVVVAEERTHLTPGTLVEFLPFSEMTR